MRQLPSSLSAAFDDGCNVAGADDGDAPEDSRGRAGSADSGAGPYDPRIPATKRRRLIIQMQPDCHFFVLGKRRDREGQTIHGGGASR